MQAEELPDEIRISTEAVQIRHVKKNGGALSSIVFSRGSGTNLLRAPLTSRAGTRRHLAAAAIRASMPPASRCLEPA